MNDYQAKFVTPEQAVKAVQSKALTAVGRPVRVGGHIGFFEVNITDDTGALIARAEINMYFLKK